MGSNFNADDMNSNFNYDSFHIFEIDQILGSDAKT